MRTFQQYIEEKEMTEDIMPSISNKIADVGNLVAQKNPNVVPGLTPPNDIKRALIGDANVKKLVRKDPTSAGAVGAYLGGQQAARALKRL